MMTHSLPFIHFKQYISTKNPHFIIYHDTYCLIQLYRTKVTALSL